MKRYADSQLDARLEVYGATIRAQTVTTALKRNAEKWSVYAAVTGAAMAMTSNASASIIYSGVIDETVTSASLQPWPLDNDFLTANKSVNLGNPTGAHFGIGLFRDSGGFQTISVRHGNINILFSNGRLKQLSSGAKISGIGNTYRNTSNVDGFAQRTAGIAQSGYAWAGTKGFFGFEFSTINRQQQDFGWARLQFNPDNEITVVDWAYENNGEAILAGSMPEPSTMALMLLAAGAAGVEALRRRRAAAK